MRLVRILITAILLSFLTACSQLSETGSEAATLPSSSSATYLDPDGWDKNVNGDIVRFQPEEKDATIAVVKIFTVSNAEEAAAKAWQLLEPGFSRALRVNTPRDTNGGWLNKRRIEYLTSLAENAVAVAYTHEAKSQWYVVLLSGNAATMNKRGAAIGELLDSFKVEGFTPEDLSDKSAKELDEKDIEQLLSFIESAANSLNVPGVGVALSQNGKVLYQGGVGVTDLASAQAVTADTLFMIASNTKGMATLLLAKLVEMGKLNWEDKVVDHYPAFKLGDEETTNSVLIEHLVCACTGLPRRDLGWVFNNELNTPASSVFDDLATTQPTSEFGSIFQYSNEMAATAGYVAGHVLYPNMEIGAAFDKAMQTYIFDPLGMENTLFLTSEALKQPHAKPYADSLNGQASEIEQTAQRGFNLTVYAYRPAGAAWSSPADMIKYVENELNQGVAKNGEILFAAEPLLSRRKAYVSTGEDAYYGMGLQTEKMAGIETLSHGGSMAGYQSNFYAFPDAGVGLVLLTNSDEGWALLKPTARKLLELLYDAKQQAQQKIDVAAERKALYQQNQQNEFTYPGKAEILDNLASSYSNATLGEIRIYQENGDVFLDPGVWRTELATKDNADGTQSIIAIAPFMMGIEFLLGKDDGMRTLTIKYSQDSYTFTEK